MTAALAIGALIAVSLIVSAIAGHRQAERDARASRREHTS